MDNTRGVRSWVRFSMTAKRVFCMKNYVPCRYLVKNDL